jgi:pyruvate kinase
MPVMQV